MRQNGEEDVIELPFARRLVLVKQQVVNVSLNHLARVTGVDRAVLAAFDEQIFGGLVAEHDIRTAQPQGLEVGAEKGCR